MSDCHPAASIAACSAAAAAIGQTKEFGEWAKEFLGEEDIYLTGAQKAQYEVPVGKSEPEDQLDYHLHLLV